MAGPMLIFMASSTWIICTNFHTLCCILRIDSFAPASTLTASHKLKVSVSKVLNTSSKCADDSYFLRRLLRMIGQEQMPQKMRSPERKKSSLLGPSGGGASCCTIQTMRKTKMFSMPTRSAFPSISFRYECIPSLHSGMNASFRFVPV